MGTILIVIGVIIGGIILFAVISGITSAPDIDKQQQWRAKLNASAQALQNRNSATLENILRKIESIDVNIPIKVERSLLNGEWLNMPDAEESFYISLSTQQIYYKERVIAFNKIINCELNKKFNLDIGLSFANSTPVISKGLRVSAKLCTGIAVTNIKTTKIKASIFFIFLPSFIHDTMVYHYPFADMSFRHSL